MAIETQIIFLLIISILVSFGARRLHVPYTVAMVITGLGVSILRAEALLTDVHLESHLILVTFLPGLLFEAAYHIDARKLRRNIHFILLLAIPGVLLSMFMIGFMLNSFMGLPLVEALLFGVLISATDPIAVVAIFKELGVDKRLNVIVEGESLFNDGAAIVIFSILAGLVSGGPGFNLAEGVVTFFVTVLGGSGLGFAAGWLVGQMMRRTDDYILNIALTALLAYGTYLFAEEVTHGILSPVIATVVAGMTAGNVNRDAQAAAYNHIVVPFWSFISFIINSALFLLIGLAIEPGRLIREVVPVSIAIGVILLTRALIVYTARWVANRFIRDMPPAWGHVFFWGGLRGAVSLALVLSLPDNMESRDLIVTITFGYVIFSLIVQGMTMRPLLQRLNLTHISQLQREYEFYRGRMAAAHAAAHAIDVLHDDNILSGPLYTQMRERFKKQIDVNWHELEKILRQDPELAEVDLSYVIREITNAQKESLRRMVQRGIISEGVSGQLAREADKLLARIEQHGWDLIALLDEDIHTLQEENEQD